jgi:hypothetical protein
LAGEVTVTRFPGHRHHPATRSAANSTHGQDLDAVRLVRQLNVIDGEHLNCQCVSRNARTPQPEIVKIASLRTLDKEFFASSIRECFMFLKGAVVQWGERRKLCHGNTLSWLDFTAQFV